MGDVRAERALCGALHWPALAGGFEEAGGRLAHLDAFFRTKGISGIGSADVTRYIAARQAEGASNGTVNRELAVLGRMLRLAYGNGKLMRVPLIHKPQVAARKLTGTFSGMLPEM